MSRTHKDKPWKHADQQSRWDYGRVRIPYESDTYAYRLYFYLDEAGKKTKKKRSHTERHWMPTPMWLVVQGICLMLSFHLIIGSLL
jgi:hypothetical protein